MDTTNPSRVSFPEEILELIISYALLSNFFSEGTDSTPCSSASALPLVCWTFNRIAKPFLFNYLHLRTRSQSDKLADLLNAQPILTSYIRGIRVDVPSASRAFLVAAQILASTQETSRRILDVIDVKLASERNLPSNRGSSPNQAKEDVARLNSALSICPDTRCLIVRHDAIVGWNCAISFAETLGSCVSRWQFLEAVDLQMKPTPAPASPGNARSDHPLAAALAKAPRLRVLRAHQPTLLNNFLLDVASNPTLERIELLNNVTVLPGSKAYFWPFLDRPFMASVGYLDRNCETDLFSTSTLEKLRHYESDYGDISGDIGPETELLAAAMAELEVQYSSEPKTLFASQIAAHPRLCELVRAGRLRLIMERLSMSRSKRRLGGDCSEGSKDKCEALPSECHCADQKLSGSCSNSYLFPQSGL